EQFSESNEFTLRIGQNVSKQQLLKKMRVAHPATFVKHEVYRDFGMFSEGFRIAADHEFLLRIWDKVAIGFLPETLVRMKIGGISTNQFVASYRESMAAAILNGMPPTSAYVTYNYEILKNILLNISRKQRSAFGSQDIKTNFSQ
ncbi:MAG: hypothetical protein KC592_19610, partial [Nitrospira sp.]|nr:hypothetical protein [Nitrospira sp.]